MRLPTLLVSAIALIVLALCIAFARRETAAPGTPTALDATNPDVRTDPVGTRLTPLPPERERAQPEAAVDEVHGSETAHEPAAIQLRVQGRVLDLNGNPVAKASISVETAWFARSEVAVSEADGSFGFDTDKSRLTLIAAASGWRTLHAFSWKPDDAEPGIIVVAPCRSVRVEIVDESSLPLPGTSVSVTLPRNPLAGFPLPLAGKSMPPRPRQWTEPVGSRFARIGMPDFQPWGSEQAGRYEFECEITLPDSRVEASRPGFLRASVPLPVNESETVHIVLVRDPTVPAREITGVVLRANGLAAVDARVTLGRESVRVDASGSFRLRALETWADDAALVAIEADQQAAVVAGFGQIVRESQGNPPPQRLVLGGPSLAIQGRVLDDHGAPIAGASVALMDWLALSNQTPVEGLVGSQDLGVSTDERGDFTLRGLFPRDYRLQVHDPKRLGRLETDPIPAGTVGAVVAYPPDAVVPEWHGRVVGRDGSPIAGANVSIDVVARRIAGDIRGQAADPSRTGADGEFVIRGVPRRWANVVVQGPGLVDLERPLEDADFVANATIVVDRYCKVRVEGLAASGNPRWLAAKDGDGKSLMLQVQENGGTSGWSRFEFRDGPPADFEVSEAAVGLLLFESVGAPALRRPMRLSPESVNVITW